MYGKSFQFLVFTLLENALNICIFMPLFPTQNSTQDLLKICFPQDEKGRENYDLLYQNSIRKYEEKLEH